MIKLDQKGLEAAFAVAPADWNARKSHLEIIETAITAYLVASPQPANPAQVTDAMVEAAMSAPPIPGRGPNVFDPDRMRAALTAAIGAGGQAVDQGLRDAAKAMGAEVARSVPVVGSQPHPADERVVEALRQIRKLSGLDDVLCEGANALVMSRMADIHQHADAALAASHMPVGDGVTLIAAERRRQIEAEGWTPEHDDTEHDHGDLAAAGSAYALHAADVLNPYSQGDGRDVIPDFWPFGKKWWKPSDDPVRTLEKAGALIAAEIDRLKRTAARAGEDGE